MNKDILLGEALGMLKALRPGQGEATKKVISELLYRASLLLDTAEVYTNE